MLLIKAKFERFKELKTRKNLILSTKEEINVIQLAQLPGTEGYLAFNSDQFKKEVEDAMRDTKIGVDESGFSKSQVLRGVLNRMWQGLDEEIGFDEFYAREMDKIINHYKAKYL